MKKVSKTVLITSAIFNGVLGILFTFLPQETCSFIGTAEQAEVDLIIMQILGAALIGIAMTNYMSRGAVLGGIYGKPLLLGNLLYHVASGLALLKFVFNSGEWILFGIPTLLYLILSAGFIKLNFTSAI